MGIGSLFETILYEPLLNGLMFLYVHLGQDMGIAIIVLTVLIKLLLFQPSMAQLKAQRSLQSTQPKLRELQAKHKGDREAYSKAVLQFYKENKVNPLSSCLPLLIQLPILIALYQVFIAGVVTDPASGLLKAEKLNNLYGSLQATFQSTPIHSTLLGFVNLAESRNVVLAVLAAVATFWQAKMLMTKRPPKEAGTGGTDEARIATMNQSTLYVMPVATLIFALSFPTGLSLYWLVSTLFQVVVQYYFLRRQPVIP